MRSQWLGRRTRRRLAVAALVAAWTLICGPLARAEGWHSAQPPPPTGDAGVGVPVPLGHVGQISFWAPNRGLLITAGTKVVPAGLYYYNGVSWRELSNVCGGTDGRIAWAGPDDFWTISDMQTGQESGGGEVSEANGRDRSLCHFVDGVVVASYAEPVGVAGSYQPMHAAACAGPSDCWFGGDKLPAGLNSGAFHLHWNGTTMTALPSLEAPEPGLEDLAQSIAAMAFYKGRLYESVKVEGVAEGESPTRPYLIHKVIEGSSKPFVPMIVEGPPGEAFSYGLSEPLRFSAVTSELWAAGGGAVLRLNGSGQFQEMKLTDPAGALSGARIGGIAAEPGTGDAWISVDTASGEGPEREAATQVARVSSTGTVEASTQLPEASEQLGRKGGAGAIACPAVGDCWVASAQGWLFHLGGQQPEDNDPYFQGLITSRPGDASVPFLAPESYPEDDSGANPPPLPSIPSPPVHESQPKVPAALFSHVSEKLVGHTTLARSFTLVTKSRVRLLARLRKRTVARTASKVFGRGRHTLDLRLSRKAWPSKLDLQVHALGAVPLVSAGSGGGHEAIGGPTDVET